MELFVTLELANPSTPIPLLQPAVAPILAIPVASLLLAGAVRHRSRRPGPPSGTARAGGLSDLGPPPPPAAPSLAARVKAALFGRSGKAAAGPCRGETRASVALLQVCVHVAHLFPRIAKIRKNGPELLRHTYSLRWPMSHSTYVCHGPKMAVLGRLAAAMHSILFNHPPKSRKFDFEMVESMCFKGSESHN